MNSKKFDYHSGGSESQGRSSGPSLTAALWIADGVLVCALLAMLILVDMNGDMPGLSQPASRTSEVVVLSAGVGLNLWLCYHDRRRRLIALSLLLLFVAMAAPAIL